MEKDFRGFSIFTGSVRHSDRAYLLGTKDTLVKKDVPHTRVFGIYRGQWGANDLSWSAVSSSVCWHPEERFIVINPFGRVYTMGGGKEPEESLLKDGQISPKTRGQLREVRGIAGGRAYAVGTCRQAYRRDTPKKWTCIDKTAQTPVKDITETSFESIDGFSETDIYTVGWEGEIWHYDGKRWEQIDSPTNLALYKTRCWKNGYIFACGQSGILLRGRNDKWEIIEHDSTTEDLFGMDIIDNRVFVASATDVYELKKDKLKPVDFGKDSPETCNHLSARDGIMWSIGAKDIMEFDSKTWRRVLKIK